MIEVNVANPRQTRGYTLAGVICDEIAFWPIDELSPKRDEDTLAALRPVPSSASQPIERHQLYKVLIEPEPTG